MTYEEISRVLVWRFQVRWKGYRERKPIQWATCHPDRRLRARGLCNSCYTSSLPCSKVANKRYLSRPGVKKKHTARQKAKRLANLDEARALSRLYINKWRKEKSHLHKAAAQKARAKRAMAPGRCAAWQLQGRFVYYNNKCAYCGITGPLEADHVIPLSRGGTNWPSNIRPACRSCNSSKRNFKLSEWAQ